VKSSHAWVFGDNLGSFLAAGAGPTDGHPALLSSYCAELSSLLGLLYIIYRICRYYDLHNHNVTIFCDNNSAIRNIFSHPMPGITPFLKPDYDLLETVQYLPSMIPLAIAGQWVKGHYNGKQREFQHDLNDKTDALAMAYQQQQQAPFHTRRLPYAPPNYSVRLLHNNTVITSKLYPTLVASLHDPKLVIHILKKDKVNTCRLPESPLGGP
jgi:hypothetical protein